MLGGFLFKMNWVFRMYSLGFRVKGFLKIYFIRVWG